eukprot:g2102.t1
MVSKGLDPSAMAAGGDAGHDLNPPEDMCCSITRLIMADPVVAADGNNYEREAILKWFESKNTSPLTNLPMSAVLHPNRYLKNQIDEWKARHGKDAPTSAQIDAAIKQVRLADTDDEAAAALGVLSKLLDESDDETAVKVLPKLELLHSRMKLSGSAAALLDKCRDRCNAGIKKVKEAVTKFAADAKTFEVAAASASILGKSAKALVERDDDEDDDDDDDEQEEDGASTSSSGKARPKSYGKGKGKGKGKKAASSSSLSSSSSGGKKRKRQSAALSAASAAAKEEEEGSSAAVLRKLTTDADIEAGDILLELWYQNGDSRLFEGDRDLVAYLYLAKRFPGHK